MSAIKRGDLVMVVKPGKWSCPCPSKALGKIFTVIDTGWLDESVCDQCDMPIVIDGEAAVSDEGFLIQTSRLIRIDPPATDESTETNKEVTA